MQTAGMLRGTRAIRFLVLLVSLIGCAHSYPLQILPSIPGYIPVYIRHGDEPLENINPALAEAFHETPSSKSIRVEHIPDAPVFDVEDENAIIGRPRKNNVHPTEGSKPTSGTDEKHNQQELGDKSSVENSPKILPTHEHHGGVQHGHLRRKPLLKQSVAKLSPLSTVEKEDLQKFSVQVTKKETNLNDLEESDSELADQPTDLIGDDTRTSDTEEALPSKTLHPEGILSNVHKLSPHLTSNDDSKQSKESSTSASTITEKGVLTKDEEPINLPTNVYILPTISTPEKETSQSSEDSTANEEPPLKMSPPAKMLSNVFKLLPSSPPEENLKSPTEDTAAPEPGAGSTTVEEEPPVKVQHPNKVLSSVVKLNPIPMSEDTSKTTLNEATSSARVTEEKKELPKEESPISKPTYIHILPTIAMPEMNPQDSEKQEDSTEEDSAKNDEPPLKMLHPAGITSNVYKLSPANLPKEEMLESREDDKMTDFTQRNDEIAMD